MYTSIYLRVCVCVGLIGAWGRNIERINSALNFLWIVEMNPLSYKVYNPVCVSMSESSLVCLGQYMSVNFTSTQFNTTQYRFCVPVLQPSRRRQPAHLLKHCMYTSARTLGWIVGRGTTLRKTTRYKQSLSLDFDFHLLFGQNLTVLMREMQGMVSLRTGSVFSDIIVPIIWGGAIIEEKTQSPESVF